MKRTASGAQSRAVAARALDAVLCQGRNLDAALQAAGLATLGDRDRSLASALAYGAARTHLRNRFIIEQLASRPFRSRDSVVVALISVGIFALTESRRPDYAVVSATVEAAVLLGRKQLKPVVNALLRRYLRERDELLASIDPDTEAAWQHPAWLVAAVQRDWPDDWQSIVDAGNRQPPMWLRVNLLRGSRSAWAVRLPEAPASLPDAMPAAVELAEPLAVSELPGFSEGECSVQDIASQAAAGLLDPGPGMRVLDACAAPGGKATHLLEHCPGIAELVALDVSAERLQRVAENMQRLNLAATLITGDVLEPDKWWDGQLFDAILLDAPCSATGVIRRHPDIRYLRQSDDIAAFTARQLLMLRTLWPMLRPGGRLLYSTCSVLRAENDTTMGRFLAETDTAAVVDIRPASPPGPTVAGDHGVYWLPGRMDNDGFYYALMRRIGPATE